MTFNNEEYREPNEQFIADWKHDTWYPVLVKLNADISELESEYEIIQIKEKFGGLRYYVQLPLGTYEDVRDLIFTLIYKAELECADIDSRNGLNRYY